MLSVRATVEGESKQVAVGTSKLNYPDPGSASPNTWAQVVCPHAALRRGLCSPRAPSRLTGHQMPSLSSVHPPESFGGA